MDRPYLGLFISGLFYIIGVICPIFLPNVFCVWTAFRYFFFFYVGMRLWKRGTVASKIADCSIYLVIVDIVLFITLMCIDRNSGMVWNIMKMGLNLVLNLVGALMAWCVLQKIASVVKWDKSNCFKTLSLYTMPMYLFHQQFIYLSILWLNGKISPWINALINFVFAFLCSYIISVLLMRWKITRILIGEKQ